MFEDDNPVRWQIEADLGDLEDARVAAGMDPNVLIPLGDVLNPFLARYRLAFPSLLCPTSVPWLKALSFLVLHNREFAIFLETLDRTDPRKVLAFVQLYPVLDAEMRALLAGFSGQSVVQIDDLGHRIELAFARLRAGAL